MGRSKDNKKTKEYEITYDYSLDVCEVSGASSKVKTFLELSIKSQKNIKKGFINQLNNKIYLAKKNGKSLKYENQVTLPSGQNKYYFIRGKYIEELDLLIGIIIDETGTNELTNKTLYNEKLKSIGSLAGGIAHDFNNQLMVILGSCELISKMHKDDKTLYYINNIQSSVKHSNDLINKLLVFGQSDQIPKGEFNLVNCITDSVSILKNTISIDKKIIYDVFIPEIYISGNYGLIQNAFLSVCKNSIEAIDVSGVLMIRTTIVDLKKLPHKAVNSVNFKQGKYALLQVTDNACGIDSEFIEKIFDPFFTTKGFSNSCGLGLSTVLGSIDLHGGILAIDSVLNKGSVVSLYFRITREVEYNMISNNEKKEIIVVDDEYLVRMVLRDVLLDLDCEVKCFESGKEALQYYKLNKEKISLVISDMMMPNMSGKDLYYELLKINNDVKFMVISGFSNEIDEKRFNDGILGYLRKPIMLNEVKEVVEKALK